MILKRLEDAQSDNDPIFGVIAGATTNHCGQTDSITRPHEGDQLSVFERILRYTNVNPLDVSYIEMHGTGTQAGDATEMNSVLSAFVPGQARMPRNPLYLGAAKANIGHAESASGVSSLIKILIMMSKNEIPPHCGIKTQINHNYPTDLKERNVHILSKPSPWHRSDCTNQKRTAFLNNFSAAGGNTAVLLEDAPLSESCNYQNDPRTTHIVTVTAKSGKSLLGNINALITFIDDNPTVSLSALSYTTTARRMHHNHRVLCSGPDTQSIKDKLKSRLTEASLSPVPSTSKSAQVVFVFTGQGNTYTGIGKELYKQISHFRMDIQRFDGIARQQGFPSFIPLIDGSATHHEAEDPTAVQLSLTCVQMALARLWVSWGVTPVATIGHSLGEYAALHAGGVLVASDIIHVVGARAQLLARHCIPNSNGMVAVKASLDVIRPQLANSSCEVACINQPTSNVISGPLKELDSLVNAFQSLGYDCIKLKIPYAFHSAQMDPILNEFEAITSNIRFHEPSIPYISPLIGRTVLDSNSLGSSYLPRASRGTVDFQGALKAAEASSIVDERTIWLEIGSHPICSDMVEGTLGSQLKTSHSLKRNTDLWKTLSGALETLYQNNVEIRWQEYHRDFKDSHEVLELPRYHWDLKNYWIQYKNDFCLSKGSNQTPRQITRADDEREPARVYISPSVQRVLAEHSQGNKSSLLIESDIHDPRLVPIFQGHKVNGVALCPSVSHQSLNGRSRC